MADAQWVVEKIQVFRECVLANTSTVQLMKPRKVANITIITIVW
jgi:hypothetical protein